MNRFAERSTRGISHCTEGDLSELREFVARMHAEEQVDRLSGSSIEWLWHANPSASGQGSGIWICRRDGQIVGRQGEIAFTLEVGDENVRAGAAIELIVDPKWRLRGVGPALAEAQRRGTRVACALWMTDAAYRLYKGLGWIDLGDVSRRVLLVHPLRLLREMRANKRRVLVSGAALPLAAAIGAYSRARARLSKRTTRLLPTERFDERADEIWREASPFYRAIARRDLQSLRWRFDECPYARRYERFYLVRGETPVGYLVVRSAFWRDLPVLTIVDYLAAPGVLRALFAHSASLAKSRSAALVEVRTRNPSGDRSLKRSGFCRVDRVEQRSDPEARVRFMCAIADDDRLHDLVATPDAWFVTIGDGDIDLLELARTTPAPTAGTRSCPPS